MSFDHLDNQEGSKLFRMRPVGFCEVVFKQSSENMEIQWIYHHQDMFRIT